MGLETTPAGKLRMLRLKETKTHPQTPFVGVLTEEPLQLNPHTGEVRANLAQESEDGVIQGRVEAKRTEQEMEGSITVAARYSIREKTGL